jgi:LSD1 subclass zinc finger protein
VALGTEVHIQLSACRVTYGPGAQVMNICTGFESDRVIISRLTDVIQDDELHALSSLFDSCQLLRRDPQTGKAVFQFGTVESAASAIRILDGYTLHDHHISARLDIPVVNVHGKLDCNLHLSFAAESQTATLRYENGVTAYNMVTYLKSSRFSDEQRSLHIYRPPGGYHRHRDIVKVEGLPANATIENVHGFALPNGQVVSLEKYGLSRHRAEKSIRQLLEPHGTLQELRFEQTPNERWSNVYVQFSDPDAAVTAAHTLTQNNLEIHQTPVHVKLNASITFLIPRKQYEVQTEEVMWITANMPAGVNVKVNGQDDTKRDILMRLYGNDLQTITRCKFDVSRVLAGAQWVKAGTTAVHWHEHFQTKEGIKMLDRIAGETGTYIRRDSLRSEVLLFGPEQCRARAGRHIEHELDKLQLETQGLPISRAVIPFFDRGGLERLKEHLPSAELDIKKRMLSARGDSGVLRTLQTAVDSANAHLERGTKRSGVVCPACTEEIVDPIRLPVCNHIYCTGCLRHFIFSVAASRDGPFPVVCVGDNNNCKQPIPLVIFNRILSTDQYRGMLENSFLAYIRARPAEFRYCPTADCPQIYRVPSMGEGEGLTARRPAVSAALSPIRCPSCFIRICRGCHSVFHDGLTCDEQEEERKGGDRLFKRWVEKNGAKQCPGCRASIQKVDGCNHIKCSVCETHICWVCLGKFGANEIYDHLNLAHGGFGL